jgi:CRP-like cAMP-binding protein
MASQMNSNHQYTLSKVKIFAGLEPVILATYEDMCSWNYYTKNQLIIDQQDNSRDIYFIIQGSVHVVHNTIDGKEIGLETLNEGRCFGEMAAIDGGLRSSTIISKGQALIARMAAQNFLDAMAHHPSIGLNVLKAMTNIIRTTNERIISLITLTANERVVAELLKYARQYRPDNNTVIFKNFPVHSEIASKAGTTRETTTRIFSALAKKGVIKRHGTSLEIRDIKMVERIYLNLGRTKKI